MQIATNWGSKMQREVLLSALYAPWEKKNQGRESESESVFELRSSKQLFNHFRFFSSSLALPLCIKLTISRVRVFASRKIRNGRRFWVQKEGQDSTRRNHGTRLRRRVCAARCLRLLLPHPQQGLESSQKPQKRFGSLSENVVKFKVRFVSSPLKHEKLLDCCVPN